MHSGKISKILIFFLILGFVPFISSVSEIDVLVVDDGHNITNYDEIQYKEGMFRDDYVSSLESIDGVDVKVDQTNYGSSGERGPPVSVLKQYDAVVWYTLADQAPGASSLDNVEKTLRSVDKENLGDYLTNHSGALYFTGHRIYYDIAGQSAGQNFYRKYLGAESTPSSSTYYRGEKGSLGNNNKIDSKSSLRYDDRDNFVFRATDSGIVNPRDVFQINTSLQPATTFRPVLDICNNRFDNDEDQGCNNLGETLRMANNIPTGSPSGDVKVKNVNTNSQTDTSSLRVEYDSGGDGRTLLVGATTLDSTFDSSEIKSARLDSGRELREVETVQNGDYTTKVFILKNPTTESVVNLNSENSTHMSAMTVTLSEAATGITLGPIKTSRSNQSTTSTTIENEEGEKIIDFVSSSSDLESDSDQEDMEDADLGNDDAGLYGFKKEETGAQEMAYKEGINYTQITLNIERDITNAEYFVEQNGQLTGNDEDVDEYATGYTSFYNNSHRSVVSTFGLESIKRNKTRNQLMEDTLRYLTGPVANRTNVTAVNNPDLAYTDVDESKYTSELVDIETIGNNKFNPSKISEARFFYNRSSMGMGPALQEDFEVKSKVLDNWSFTSSSGGEYEVSGRCGARFGGKALNLYGTPGENDGLFGGEVYNDNSVLTSDTVDLSSASNVTLSAWIKAPPADWDSECDGPYDSDYLYFGLKGPDDSDWSYVGFEAQYYRNWDRINIDIPSSFQKDGTKFRILNYESQDEDTWLVDDFTVHQPLESENGYSNNLEQGDLDNVNLTKIESQLSDDPTGVNVSIGVQFKDSSNQGYWGPMEKRWVKVDTQAPDVRIATLDANSKFVNYEDVEFTYENSIVRQERADYVRFTCDSSSGEWSRWKPLDKNQQEETVSFDITNTSAGCTTSQGNRTVYGQFRDYAGNIPDQMVQDCVMYDTTPPTYEGETPENRSAIQGGEEVYINASDDEELTNSNTVYFNTSENITFTPNTKFDPGFGSEGLTTGVAYIFDKASNLNRVPVAFDLDNTPPASNVTPLNKEVPTNNTAVNSGFNMIINITERNFDRVKINDGDGNQTFEDKDVNYTTSWSEGASQDLVLWMKDRAGNRKMANYTYDVDDTPPIKGAVKEKNQSYILNSTRLGYNFSDSITGVASTSVSENKVGLRRYDLGVETGWTTEGSHYLQVNASDVLNKRTLNFTYIVDETPPETDVNFPDYSKGSWTDRDVSVNINATDNMNMSTISYCKRSTGGSCQLDSESQPDKNVSETVNCAEGDTCRKVLVYNSRDSAGNKFSSNPVVSPEIKIDKEAPEVDNLRPSGGTTSGNVTISAEISDSGSGISSTEITIYNSSDPSQVYEQGSMSEESDEWRYQWNSEEYITGAGDVTVNISASDQLNYKKSKEAQFSIDNQRVNVRIDTPFQEIVNEGFRLNITAVRPGSEDVSSHNYSINQSSTEVYSNETTSINEGTHRYDLPFDTSEIQDDGNYTLNTSAKGGGDGYSSTETWFYLDREAPEAEILSELNDTWQTGEITVDFKAYDTVENGSLKYRYRDDGGSWSEEALAYGQENFTFPTSERCDDDSQADCQIKLVAEDEAGNINTSVVSFKVDNSRPSVTIDSPDALSWQDGDFQVERTIKDEEAENSEEGLSCEYMINNSGTYQNSENCNSSISVDIPQDYQDEEFEVSVKASNPAGLEREVDRTFRIDTNPPQVTQSYPRPASESIINGNQSITFYFEDEFSGIVYRVLDDGNDRGSISEGESYEPEWSTSGQRTLDLELNDTAGNFKENSYTYTFDNRKPEINGTSLSRPFDDFYDEVRVYRGQSLEFNVSVIENIKMERAVLEVNETGTMKEHSLSAPEDLQNGTWSTDLPTQNSGYYNFTALKLVDEAGNTVTNTSLDGYRVVNYSQTVKLGENSEIDAGREQEFNFTVNFYRTVGERELDIYVPPSSPDALNDPYFDLSGLNCGISGCNISVTENLIELNYTGDRETVNVTGDIHAETEPNDRNQPFISEIAGNTRESSTLLRTPELEVGNLSCEIDCTVDQFANFTLDIDALNNQTSDNTGRAYDVTLSVFSNSSKNPIEKNKSEGEITSGEGITETFENLSFDQAGTFKVQTVIEDATGDYSNSASLDVKVRDILKPKVNDTSPSRGRININDSITLESNITDNTRVKSANLTLELPNGTERILEMSESRGSRFFTTFENTSKQGIYNITKVEALDQAGNERTVIPGATFKVVQLRVDANVSETNISNNESVNFSLNITGNSSEISNVEINATTPKKDYRVSTYDEVTTNDTLNFEKFENSGNYSFNVTVNSDFSITNQTKDVFVRFGNAVISSLSGENNTILIPERQDVEVPWRVLTENGSIRDVSLEFDSLDSGVISAPQNTQEIGNLTAEKDRKTAEFTFSPENTGNTSVEMTVTPENGTQNSTTVDIWVNETDQQAPKITDYRAEESILNLGENQSFTAKVEEQSVIKNLTLEIESNETGNTWKKQMERTGKGSFGYNFSESDEVAFYNYSITAYDVSGNNMTRKGNYTVSDNYQIQVSHGKDTYVKGDTPQFDIEVLDMSGEEVENYSATVKLEKGSEESTLASGYVEEASTTIFSSDPPSASESPGNLPLTYDLEVNVTKNQNQGLYTEGIDVTRILRIRDFEVVEEFIPKGGNFTVQGRWVEPVGYEVDGLSPSFLSCRECEEKFKQFEKINSSTNLRRQTLSVPKGTDSVLVQAVVSNAFGNSESQLSNDPEPSLNVEIGGQGTETNNTDGGGFPSVPGGGGGPSMEITRLSPEVNVPASAEDVNLSVNTNIAATCVYSRNSIPDQVSFSEASEFQNTGGVTHSTEVEADRSITYSYDVMCASENANATSSIVFSKGEVDVTSFRVPSFPGSLTPGNETVSQGENVTSSFVVENNMSSDTLNLEFEYNSDCCEGFVSRKGKTIQEAEIGPQGSREFTLGIDVPLSAEEGTYRPTLLIRSENSSQPPKRRQPDFQILDSDAISRFKELRQRAQILNSSIRRYGIAGIDTSRERELFDELVDSIEDANLSIRNDNITGLRRALDIGYSSAESIDSGLQDEAWKKYLLLNWWKWALGFVVVYILFFLVTVVGIPYYRIQTELVRIESELEDQVEARKKGEKQYFKRQIDKDTFNSMMQDRQNEILELRGEKEDLNDELDGFLWSKLTLENYLKAPWKGIEELEKWWAANKRARQNLNKDSGDEGDE